MGSLAGSPFHLTHLGKWGRPLYFFHLVYQVVGHSMSRCSVWIYELYLTALKVPETPEFPRNIQMFQYRSDPLMSFPTHKP